MNVLILGLNGFIGNAIAHSALSKNHQVFGLSRSAVPTQHQETVYISGSRSDSNLVVEIIKNQKIDVLVDVLAMTLSDTQPLLDSVDGRISQYVMISSSDVYRNYELFQRKATGTPTIESLSEDAPLRTTRFPYRAEAPRPQDSADRYLDDYDKIPIESATRKILTNWTILRLPMVYGPGDKQKRFRWAIGPMTSGAREIVFPKRWLDWHSTYGYVSNVAEAVTLTFGNQKAMNRVFNIGEQPCLSHLEWAKRIADVIGWQGKITEGEESNSPLVKATTNLDLTVPFKVSSSRIREELGFREIVGPAQALRSTIDSDAPETSR